MTEESKLTEEIINLIRGYPELYVKEHPEYKNLNKKAIAWEKIEEKIGIDVPSLKKKWKNLRDTYKKHKDSQKITCGRNSQKYVNWVWREQMAFLDCTTTLIPPESKSTIDNISEYLCTELNESHERNAQSTEGKQCTEDLEVKQMQGVPANNVRFRKRRRACYPTNKTIGFLQRRSSTTAEVICDRLDMEFLGFAGTVKKFSLRNQAIVKLEIAKIITSTQIQELENHS